MPSYGAGTTPERTMINTLPFMSTAEVLLRYVLPRAFLSAAVPYEMSYSLIVNAPYFSVAFWLSMRWCCPLEICK